MQSVEAHFSILQGGKQIAVVHLGHVLIWKIDPRRKGGCDLHKSVANGLNTCEGGTVFSRKCRLMRLLAFGTDEVHHRFGGGKVELAVFKGAAGKFACVCHSRAVGENCAQGAAKKVGSAVAEQFNDILARVGMGRDKSQGNRFVNKAVGIAHLSKGGAVSR